MKRYILATSLCCILTAFVSAGDILAQSHADSLRKAYDFRAAVDWCRPLVESADSSSREALESELILAQNGLNMMAYCSQPVVVARYQFSLDDFFLYYPLKDRSWRSLPNQLDSLGGNPFAKAVYIPRGEKDIYFSAPDAEGIYNIYNTHMHDSLWTSPRLINEGLTSSADEIYPILSKDGKSLYFASAGLYGMGGYDLYVSHWNDKSKDWDVPVNMGFPYSSPYDDFLFVNTDDGRYSIFASNRECAEDSVYVYVLEYDSMPVRKAVESVSDLQALARLVPQEDASKMDTSSAVSEIETEDANIREYMSKMAVVRDLRDSLNRFRTNLDELRKQLGSDESKDKQALTDEVLNREIALQAMQNKLDKAVKDLQKTEMEFLMSGVAINPDKLKAEADREVVGAASNYALSKNAMGSAFELEFEEEKAEADYNFRISELGQLAEDNSLPQGLVYQIRLFVIARKANAIQFKGISPVFENNEGGRYVYRAGLFKSYPDALAQLNAVKKLGFKAAMIEAFDDGQLIPVSDARKLEAAFKETYRLHITPAGGQTLSESVIMAIRNSTDKDIIRMLQGNQALYEVGPFDSKEQCEALRDAVMALGSDKVEVIASSM